MRRSRRPLPAVSRRSNVVVIAATLVFSVVTNALVVGPSSALIAAQKRRARPTSEVYSLKPPGTTVDTPPRRTTSRREHETHDVSIHNPDVRALGTALADVAACPDGQALEIIGRLPTWLSGALIRNGPGRWSPPSHPHDRAVHLFDGYAMLCRFALDGKTQSASFRSRYLMSDAYRHAERSGSRLFSEFGTTLSVLEHPREFVKSVLNGGTTDNAVVSVTRVAGDRLLASTETTRGAWELDPVTLETKRRWRVRGPAVGPLQTAHAEPIPKQASSSSDDADVVVNVGTSLFPTARYSVFRVVGHKDHAVVREVVATIPSRSPFEASWVHAFGVTQKVAVVIETPAVYDLGALVLGTGRAEHVSFNWRPDRGTWIHVVDLEKKNAVRTLRAPRDFFFFHCANAFHDDDDAVCVDVAAFDDASIIDTLRLRDMEDATRDVPACRLMRIRIADDGVTMRAIDDAERSGNFAEFAQCDDRVRGRADYRYVYACGARHRPTSAANVVTKTNVQTGTTRRFESVLEYVAVGEPVFVPRESGDDAHDQAAEDDGAVLSIGHTKDGEAHLVVFDAATCRELARVVVPYPGIPYGFHVLWDPSPPAS